MRGFAIVPSTFAGRIFTTLAVVVCVLALITVGPQFSMSWNAQIKAAEQNQQAMARALSVGVQGFLTLMEDEAKELVTWPWETPLADGAVARDELKRLLRLNPALDEAVLLRANGTAWVSVSRMTPDQIQAAAGESRAELPNPGYSSVSFNAMGRPVTRLTVRSADPNRHYLRVQINLSFVSEVISRLGQDFSGVAYVVDASGRLVAHTEANAPLVRLDYRSHAPVEAALASPADPALVGGAMIRSLPTSRLGSGGGEVYTSFAPVGKTGFWALIEQPRDEVLRPVMQLLAGGVVVLLLVLAGGLWVAVHVARRLAAPVRALHRGAARIAEGRLDTRLDIRTGDELEELGNEFNRMAAQLEDYTRHLEEKVAAKTAEIERVNCHQEKVAAKTAELERVNRHKSEFVANMSHELRTPLNSIIGFSEVLRSEMFGELNERQKEYASDINESGVHLLALINDILDLSKVEAGKMEIEKRPFSLRATIETVIQLVRGQCAESDVHIDFKSAPGVDVVKGDERRIKQVLINLVSNAIKFSFRGGVVSIIAAANAGEVIVTVSDCGPGIAPKDHEMIFTAFTQIKPANAWKNQGTGLGLALVKQMVALHGGRVWLESEPGQGARFSFSLPIESIVQAES